MQLMCDNLTNLLDAPKEDNFIFLTSPHVKHNEDQGLNKMKGPDSKMNIENREETTNTENGIYFFFS